jgi:hypothetical protein
MRKLLLALEARLFALWLMDRHKRDHPIEWVLYHGYGACGRLSNAMRPRRGAR